MSPSVANAIKEATTTYNADGTENTNLLANTMGTLKRALCWRRNPAVMRQAGANGAAIGELVP